MLQLDEANKNEINVDQLKDGQIAVITTWPLEDLIGSIVQRYNDSLIILGKSSLYAFLGILGSNINFNDHRVRILNNNTKLVVVNNE